MSKRFGITEESLDVALRIKEDYRDRKLVCLPGDETSLLIPEHLLNHDLDLHGIEDPLPLAMVAARDPEPPMALAAATRLTPLARHTKLVGGVFGVVGETTKHPLVRRCVALISDNTFSPASIAHVRRHARHFVVKTHQQYTTALRHNLKALMDGAIAPRQFVAEFFELTEAGNLRADIRKKLLLSLLLSDNIRLSIKFLFLENLHRLPPQVRATIVAGVEAAETTQRLAQFKEELRWVVAQGDAWGG